MFAFKCSGAEESNPLEDDLSQMWSGLPPTHPNKYESSEGRPGRPDNLLSTISVDWELRRCLMVSEGYRAPGPAFKHPLIASDPLEHMTDGEHDVHHPRVTQGFNGEVAQRVIKTAI
ncbi:hypothetical protein EYF80_049042 [Liparis tanakae]|uniref:Uncharacterized protein n=1 Tax=Liparis tanakae TaxID=230148 RepID=A0A4Z2FKJ6_9TELE|nr:hypothetical protein EYF80_049042 [Liparis tanakae]